MKIIEYIECIWLLLLAGIYLSIAPALLTFAFIVADYNIETHDCNHGVSPIVLGVVVGIIADITAIVLNKKHK